MENFENGNNCNNSGVFCKSGWGFLGLVSSWVDQCRITCCLCNKKTRSRFSLRGNYGAGTWLSLHGGMFTTNLTSLLASIEHAWIWCAGIMAAACKYVWEISFFTRNYGHCMQEVEQASYLACKNWSTIISHFSTPPFLHTTRFFDFLNATRIVQVLYSRVLSLLNSNNVIRALMLP